MMRTHLSREQIAELMLAVGIVAFGGLVIYETRKIRITPAYSEFGPHLIPYAVGVILMVLGVWFGIEVITGHTAGPTEESEDVDPTLPTDWLTVGLLAASLGAYLLLMERTGFIIASSVLFFGAAFAMGSRHYLRDALIAVAVSAVAFYIFTDGLGLRLPAGWLG
jgi:putative tricarboxylic transport membrane protein